MITLRRLFLTIVISAFAASSHGAYYDEIRGLLEEPPGGPAPKFVALYYGAQWCAPCRVFSPKLVDWYKKTKAAYSNFELVFVSYDRNEAEMRSYIQSQGMPWPVAALSQNQAEPFRRYAPNAIPYLVLINENGEALTAKPGNDWRDPSGVLSEIEDILATQRKLYSHGDPTAYEQYMLELVNAARANPAGQAAWLGVDLNQGLPAGTISTFPKQPLAFHPLLTAAARSHSDWMLSTGIFSHTGVNGSSPSQRAEAYGFPYGASENIAWKGTTGGFDPAEFTLSNHNGLFKSPGHRKNLMAPSSALAGMGLRVGLYEDGPSSGDFYDALMVTQKFSSGGDSVDAGAFILGVVYSDSNKNNFYDPKEGVGSIRITPSMGNYAAVTSSSGGYAIPIEVLETRTENVSLPIGVRGASWESIKVYDDEYRARQIAAAPWMNVSLAWSGGPLPGRHTEFISIKRPVRIHYKLTGTDGWHFNRTMVTAENVKRDLEIGRALVAPGFENFRSAGGWQAYIAGNPDLLNSGVHDESSAFAHWRDYGNSEGRRFALGGPRSDLTIGAIDHDYAIDGGFAWKYPDSNGRRGDTVVFITKDAPKPTGWDGRELLLRKGDLFNLGPEYTARAYRALNADVRDAIDAGRIPNFASVTDHYVKYGFKEGRVTNGNWTQAEKDAWNDEVYLTRNPDVRDFFLGAQNEGWKLLGKIGFAHYINFGRWEGRAKGQ